MFKKKISVQWRVFKIDFFIMWVSLEQDVLRPHMPNLNIISAEMTTVPVDENSPHDCDSLASHRKRYKKLRSLLTALAIGPAVKKRGAQASQIGHASRQSDPSEQAESVLVCPQSMRSVSRCLGPVRSRWSWAQGPRKFVGTWKAWTRSVSMLETCTYNGNIWFIGLFVTTLRT